MSRRNHALLQLGILILAWIYLIGLHWRNDGLWFQGDSPRHAANGLFWKEFLLSGSLHPRDYALQYYARYPVISPTNYPPVFYILEASAFAAFRPSPFVAKGLVLVFALMAACYLMAWLRRWVAIEAGWAAALLLLLPGFVLWSNAVMLNVPSTALSLAALYHARRWLEASCGSVEKRQKYLAAALYLLATLTYFLAGIFILVPLAWMLASRRWALLWNWGTVCTALAVVVLSLPFVYIAFEYAPIYVSFVTKNLQNPVAVSAIPWTFYIKKIVEIAGPCLLVVSGLGLASGMVRRQWRRESFMLLVFMLVSYLALSVISAKESRYALLLCVPIVCFCAMAAQSLAEWLGRRLKDAEKVSTFAMLSVALVVCGAQAWMAAKTRVPCVQGIRELVAFIEHVAPDEAVFYDGYYHNIFTFFVQAGDPGYKRRVVLGGKLLYASSIQPMWRYRSYVYSSDDIIKALQMAGGCRWLVIEISKQSEQIPAAALLRKTIQGPQFQLVRSFPVSGPGLDRIDVYRFKLNPRPIAEVDLPFPNLGKDVRFRARPIQR